MTLSVPIKYICQKKRQILRKRKSELSLFGGFCCPACLKYWCRWLMLPADEASHWLWLPSAHWAHCAQPWPQLALASAYRHCDSVASTLEWCFYGKCHIFASVCSSGSLTVPYANSGSGWGHVNCRCLAAEASSTDDCNPYSCPLFLWG